jgi:predicted XRE-type DNA-binding protein
MKKEKIEYEVGSGNVFKDLGLENADELLIRARMIMAINDVVKARGLTQANVAKLVGLTQPDVSFLLRGAVRRFSTDRIMQVLARLGRDVEIRITPTPARRAAGRITVKAA